MERHAKWIRGKYYPYITCEGGGYGFDIIIDEHFRVSGKGFQTQEERDVKAGYIANEFKILLESEIYERIPNPES